jgi:hypothetical protein
MNPCHEYRDKILRYLEDDLRAHELNDFRNHLKACPDSRASLEAEKALSNLLHDHGPYIQPRLHFAPACLRPLCGSTNPIVTSPIRLVRCLHCQSSGKL